MIYGLHIFHYLMRPSASIVAHEHRIVGSYKSIHLRNGRGSLLYIMPASFSGLFLGVQSSSLGRGGRSKSFLSSLKKSGSSSLSISSALPGSPWVASQFFIFLLVFLVISSGSVGSGIYIYTYIYIYGQLMCWFLRR